jgi:hypothetical protein
MSETNVNSGLEEKFGREVSEICIMTTKQVDTEALETGTNKKYELLPIPASSNERA